MDQPYLIDGARMHPPQCGCDHCDGLRESNNGQRDEVECDCGGDYYRDDSCGVPVCDHCGDHKGLARCYCGWSATGGDGYSELLAMGEQIEEDY